MQFYIRSDDRPKGFALHALLRFITPQMTTRSCIVALFVNARTLFTQHHKLPRLLIIYYILRFRDLSAADLSIGGDNLYRIALRQVT